MHKKLTPQMIEDITTEYYSRFCTINISQLKAGNYFICSEERDKKLKGLGCKYSFYIFIKDDICIVSYSPKHKVFVEMIDKFDRDEIISLSKKNYNLKQRILMIFDKEIIKNYGNAVVLKDNDYPFYKAFFKKAYPKANTKDWLYDYYLKKTNEEYFTGYFRDNELLSVCDAPDMPYMENEIQHTGIKTLKKERRKGYASCTAALAAHNLIEKGVCPQWDCKAENIASFELAKSIGYKEYAVAYILEEW